MKPFFPDAAEPTQIANGCVHSDNETDPRRKRIEWTSNPGEHIVQFYEHDAHLARTVASFIGGGLDVGMSGIVIAAAGHRDAVKEEMVKQGLDVAAAEKNGHLVSLDAAETLSRFMVNGSPDELLFEKVIGSTLRKASNPQGIRAFGEMVALLWAQGNGCAAIRLEQLWNNLARKHSFSLLCAYPINAFGGMSHNAIFNHICDAHSRVIPAEGHDDAGEASGPDQREIAQLQQKALWLQQEIAERKRTEEALHKAKDELEHQVRELQELHKESIALRRQIADQLKERDRIILLHQQLAAIVESSDDAIIGKDLNGVITSWNQGAERIFGYSKDEVIGKPVTILIPAERQSEEAQILARIRSGRRIDHYETVRRRKDGKLLDISLTISPLKNAEGEIVGASKIARDISERVKVERALKEARNQLARTNVELEQRIEQRTASLREAIEQMEEFSYTVSHDLRAPVRAMHGYAKVLMEDYGDRLDEQGREYLDRIIRGGTRMDRLIQDMLTYSRLSRREIQLQPVSLDKLIHEIAQQYPEISSSRAHVVIQQPLLSVRAHEPSLTQAISNLINNAIKFVSPGTTPRVRIRTEARDDQVRLWIEDNGIGIKPEHQHRLFGMFERIHPEKRYEGTGIGLAIVRKALERMGGSAGVESDGLTGSNFWIQLPAAETT